MVTFQCPHCGLITQVDPRYAGQSGPCAGCGRMIFVPAVPLSPPSAARQPRMSVPTWLKTTAVLSLILIGSLLLAGLLVQWLRPAVTNLRQNARQNACHAKVERLLGAMEAYRNEHGTLPPAYTVDAQGAAQHSSRMLLLPYLGPESQAIYQQLKLDEPWDSPHNQLFAGRAPDCFVCPDDQQFSAGDTSYCVVLGESYAFRGPQGVDPAQIRDDPATTLLIVETHGSGINWMQPRDVTAVDLAQGINSSIRGSCGSRHPGGVATVGTADGRGTRCPRPQVQIRSVRWPPSIEANPPGLFSLPDPPRQPFLIAVCVRLTGHARISTADIYLHGSDPTHQLRAVSIVAPRVHLSHLCRKVGLSNVMR